MSVSAIGGMSHQVTFASMRPATRPETAEVAGRPDHDGDSDDRATSAAAPGRSLNVLA